MPTSVDNPMTPAFRFVQPCSPVTAKTVPAGDDWLHEPKLNGYRLQVIKEGRRVRLYSRRGHEWSKRLTALAEALRGIPAYSAVVDAELCSPGPDGVPNFAKTGRLATVIMHRGNTGEAG